MPVSYIASNEAAVSWFAVLNFPYCVHLCLCCLVCHLCVQASCLALDLFITVTHSWKPKAITLTATCLKRNWSFCFKSALLFSIINIQKVVFFFFQKDHTCECEPCLQSTTPTVLTCWSFLPMMSMETFQHMFTQHNNAKRRLSLKLSSCVFLLICA